MRKKYSTAALPWLQNKYATLQKPESSSWHIQRPNYAVSWSEMMNFAVGCGEGHPGAVKGHREAMSMGVPFWSFLLYDGIKSGGERSVMKRETTPAGITDRIMELCDRRVPGAAPVYVPVQVAGWSLVNECFPNVQRMVREQGGQQVNGWAVWQWANIAVTLEAHAVWENLEGKLEDITPHICGEREILFLRDNKVVYSGKPIGSIRQPLTGSPLVAERLDY